MSYTPLQFELFPARADQVAGNKTTSIPEVAAEQKAAKFRPEKPKNSGKVRSRSSPARATMCLL